MVSFCRKLWCQFKYYQNRYKYIHYTYLVIKIALRSYQMATGEEEYYKSLRRKKILIYSPTQDRNLNALALRQKKAFIIYPKALNPTQRSKPNFQSWIAILPEKKKRYLIIRKEEV